MKTMLILGNDCIAHKAMAALSSVNSKPIIVLDKSTDIKRILKLVWRGRLSLFLLIKMYFCELIRSFSGSLPIRSDFVIKNNHDLLSVINDQRPNRIVLFRAGLVINSEIIYQGIPLLNIHCANVPEYGGLGSIFRALKDGSVKQNATLHKVTTTIDKGHVYDVLPFELNLRKSYCNNENVAYEAGVQLLIRSLNSDIGLD